ncbi:aldo/keto reductase [Eubacteriales bacterium OttesenSCG-928-N13]|nr:aldo/keto reductase [Eubacteriales bacterium OttesenSCG-928-N13]
MNTFELPGGDRIPTIGFGTFGSDHCAPEQMAQAVETALTAGYRLIDCAQVYGNEHTIGEVLERAIGSEQISREELFVASKVWNDQHAPGKPTLALKGSLSDLRLDYLDAYYVHWPFPNYHAPGCDGDSRNPDSKPFSAEEFMGVWRELEQLYDEGLVRHLGMSNMTISKLETVLPQCRVQPALIEMELHPSFQQPELFQYCLDHGIRPVGFCPLGSPNRPERDKTEEDVVDFDLPEVRAIAEAHGVHPASICLKWAAQKGAIPIPFSTTERNITSNLLAVNEDPLTETEMASLAAADRDCRLIKGQVFLWPDAHSWQDLWI